MLTLMEFAGWAGFRVGKERFGLTCSTAEGVGGFLSAVQLEAVGGFIVFPCGDVGSCVGLWLVDWLMITNLCFELVAVAVGLAAIAVDFLNSLMIVCYSRPSTLDR